MSLLTEFKKFALRGNLVDMAVGFTVGAAFTTVAKSVVVDLIMPVIGLLAGGADFADLFILLAPGELGAPPYETLAAAQTAGAVTWNYGVFINNLLAFLLVALVMFIIIRMMNRIEDELEEGLGKDAADPEGPSHKKCPQCRTQIPYKARRCPNCTSELSDVDGSVA
ncbi:MAG: large conductance mechanosensitive channel protein MscL [Pseudomonadales bacterium]